MIRSLLEHSSPGDEEKKGSVFHEACMGTLNDVCPISMTRTQTQIKITMVKMMNIDNIHFYAFNSLLFDNFKA